MKARLLAVLIAASSVTQAQLPTGASVAAGKVSFAQGASTLTINQTTQAAIVNWQSFNIGAGSQVNLVQPNASAAMLARVVGGSASTLQGLLQANGQLYLLNPNGILVGPDGRVNTAGFIASTLDISDQQFMQGGALTLKGASTAGVVVLGSVQANDGDVLLVAAQVNNQGKLLAPNGQAVLAAGSEVLYVPGEYANIVVAAPAPSSGAEVSNTGLIKAASAELAAAGTAYQLAVNNGGQISATAVAGVGGHVVLEAGNGDLVDSGGVSAVNGSTGGDITLSGGRIALTGAASVDASGLSGGGSVTLAASNAISVESGATLLANATQSGDGGAISVKAGTATEFDGLASAVGGPLGGDGGQAEISGGALSYGGTVNLTAPLGRAGTLLFDPDDITIVSGNAAASSNLSNGLWSFAEDSGSQTISVGAIETLLASANLELQATDSITLQAAAPISSSTTNTLTLTAFSTTVNSSISLPNGVLVFNWPNAAAGTYGYGQSVTSSADATLTAKTIQIVGDSPTVTFNGPVATSSLQFIEPTDEGSQPISSLSATIANAANTIQAVSFDPSESGNVADGVDIETSTAMTVSGNLQMQSNSVLLASGDLTLAAGTVLQGGPILSLASTGGVFVNQAGSDAVTLGNGQVLIYSSTSGVGASGAQFNDGGLGAAAQQAQNYGTATNVTYPNNPNTIDTLVEYFGASGSSPTLSITADTFTRLYGQPDPTFTATYSGGSGTGASELTTLPSFRILQGSDINAGTYTIQPYGAASSVDQLNYIDGLLYVNPAPLTVTANSGSMTYGGTVPSLGFQVSGLVNGDSSSVISGVQLSSRASSIASVGGYTIAPSGGTVATPAGGSEPNYSVTYQSGTLTIDPALLTVTALAANASYGSALPAFQLTYSGFVNQSDASSVPSQFVATVGASQGSAVGAYPITLANQTPNANYAVTFVGANLTINPVSLVITPNLSSVYGSATPTVLSASDFSGFVNGDTPQSLSAGPVLSTAGTSSASVGKYSVTASGAVDPNYNITYDPGTITITPALLTITANSAARLYGANNPTFGVTDTGLVNSDSASVVSGLTVTTAATSTANVGTYAISLGGASAANYTISYVPGVLTVDPAPLTITANNFSRLYGASNPALTVTYAGLVNSDTGTVVSGLSETTTASSTSNVGAYGIALSGGSAANYTISEVPGVLTVNPAPLSIVASAASANYGSVLPTLQLSYSGFVNPSDATSLPSQYTATVGAKQGSNAGVYPIALANSTVDANYAVTFVGANLTIDPVPLVITPTLEITTGQTVPTDLPAEDFSGFVNGDTQMNLSTLPGIVTLATSAFPPGKYAVTAKGAIDPNYVITYTPATLTIDATPLTDLSPSILVTSPTNTIDTSATITTNATVSTTIQQNMVSQSQVNLSWSGIFTIGSENAITGQGAVIIQDYVDNMNANGTPTTVAAIEALLADPSTQAATEALLLPYVMADLSNILAEPQSEQTTDQTAFVNQVASFIQAQRQAAAIQAENDYATWHQQEVAQEIQQIESVPPGIAQMEMAAIASGNPSVPPSSIMQEASVGMGMTSAQLGTLAGIQSTTNTLVLAASDPSALAGYVPGATGEAGELASLVSRTALNISGAGGITTDAIAKLVPKIASAIWPTVAGKLAINKISRVTAAVTDTMKATNAADAAVEIGVSAARGMEIGGAIAEVVGNVAQIAVGAAAYGRIDTFNTTFNQVIAADNQPVTAASLSAMFNSSSGAQSLYGYLEDMAATNGTTPVVTSLGITASVYESQTL